MKRTIQVILLGFVVVSLVYAVWGKGSKRVDAEESATAKAPQPAVAANGSSEAEKADAVCAAEEQSKVIVYYFHGDRRCHTCRMLEEDSHKAINSAFADELSQGKLEWRTVNTDRAENQHFVKKYKLHASTLLLSKLECGKETTWKNLEQIWRLAGQDPEFFQFVQENVKGLLG